eukprot:GEZU01014300.1.p1 GENE.GEZU01014300.1~~GEZU01014300.1.p1  ORF type:complete len:126 (-),score=3.23 GEZU01014300.1:95-472(-)
MQLTGILEPDFCLSEKPRSMALSLLSRFKLKVQVEPAKFLAALDSSGTPPTKQCDLLSSLVDCLRGLCLDLVVEELLKRALYVVPRKHPLNVGMQRRIILDTVPSVAPEQKNLDACLCTLSRVFE